jgi:hypothetical protein
MILLEFTKNLKVKKSSAPAVKLLKSGLECEAHSCLFSNLYVINRKFHVFLDNYSEFQENTVYSGIGQGSFIFIFTSNLSEREDGRKIPIYLHSVADLPKYAINLNYYKTPIFLFSVLWDNLFRTMYAGAGVFYTMARFRFYFPDHVQLVLVDQMPTPRGFVSLLQAAVDPGPKVMWWDSLKDGVYKGAIMGISKDVIVEEISLEKHFDWRFSLRNYAFQSFAERIKKNFRKNCKAEYRDSKIPKVLLILRTGSKRNILNQQEVIDALSELPIQLETSVFSQISLNQQFCLIESSDMVISLHGAALSHVMFMKPKSFLIEIFPFSFRKTIFNNLANMMDVNYLYWQNNRWSNTKTFYNLIESNKLTNMTKERVQMLPIDWYNMDSKNYWRNQDTVIDVNSVLNVLVTIIFRCHKYCNQEVL